MREDKSLLISYLEQQKMDNSLIYDIVEFREKYDTAEKVQERVYIPDMLFYGKDILEMSAAALLQGENLLLSGAKATGKNVLCETLAWIFGRPSYDISFHVNTDSASLIGTDTFIHNEVQLRKGPVYQCAEFGGFGILDEVNMAKNDAVSVLQAFEVRRARTLGISVLGIFAGNYEDTAAEKRIFGKDFAYIRDIRNFSRVAGAYLRRQLEEE